jgi:hypothetical protein
MKRKFAMMAAALVMASVVAQPASAQSFRDMMRARSANTANVEQSGTANGAGVAQTGRGNNATLLQGGRNNTGTIQQDGNNNDACLVQYGRNNTGGIVQSGNRNNVGVIQGTFGTQVMSAEECARRAAHPANRMFVRHFGR